MLQIRTSQSKDIIYSLEISEITKSDKHLSFRSSKQIKKATKLGEFIFVFQGRNLAGFVEIQKIWKNWYAIFSFFVKPDFRHQGIARRLINKIIVSHKNNYLYAATSNKIMLHLLQSAGFNQYNIVNMPVQFLVNYFVKRFFNLQLLHNIKHLKNNWYYLVWLQNEQNDRV